MKKIYILIIFILLTKIIIAQPPFNPWVINMEDATAANTYKQDLVVFLPILPNDVDTLQHTPPCYDNPEDSCDIWDKWKHDTAIAIHPKFPCCPILIN